MQGPGLGGSGRGRLPGADLLELRSQEEYIDIVCDELELLDEKIVIHRITGDPIKELLIEPKWLLKKVCVLNDIDKEMAKRDTYQGKKKIS